MEVRSPFQQLSAPVTRLQCHPWSCFFIPFLQVSLTGQGKLHFTELYGLCSQRARVRIRAEPGSPSSWWILKPPQCWIKRGLFCPNPQKYIRAIYPSCAGGEESTRKHGHPWLRSHHWCCAENNSVFMERCGGCLQVTAPVQEHGGAAHRSPCAQLIEETTNQCSGWTKRLQCKPRHSASLCSHLAGGKTDLNAPFWGEDRTSSSQLPGWAL